MKEEYKAVIEMVNKKYDENIEVFFGGLQSKSDAISLKYDLLINYQILGTYSSFIIRINESHMGSLDFVKNRLIELIDYEIVFHYKNN